jgi:uncharacterized membrane protein YgdD (TMEM256/DUF423 family)
MHKNFLVVGAVFGGVAVILGAFGAHGMEKITQDEKILHAFQTAVLYQLFHALALLAVALVYGKLPVKWIIWSGNCFIAGILLFSGSIYMVCYLKMIDNPATKWIGPITPFGGLLLIAGWFLLVIGARSSIR